MHIYMQYIQTHIWKYEGRKLHNNKLIYIIQHVYIFMLCYTAVEEFGKILTPM